MQTWDPLATQMGKDTQRKKPGDHSALSLAEATPSLGMEPPWVCSAPSPGSSLTLHSVGLAKGSSGSVVLTPLSSVCWPGNNLICLYTELALLMGLTDSSSKSRAEMGLCSGPLSSLSICCMHGTDGKSWIAARPLLVLLAGSLGVSWWQSKGETLCAGRRWGKAEKAAGERAAGGWGRSLGESCIFNKAAPTWRSMVHPPSPSASQPSRQVLLQHKPFSTKLGSALSTWVKPYGHQYSVLHLLRYSSLQEILQWFQVFGDTFAVSSSLSLCQAIDVVCVSDPAPTRGVQARCSGDSCITRLPQGWDFRGCEDPFLPFQSCVPNSSEIIPKRQSNISIIRNILNKQFLSLPHLQAFLKIASSNFWK